jgi:hypothetical protein
MRVAREHCLLYFGAMTMIHPARGEVSPVRERERVFAVCDRAAPGTSPAQGKDQITDGSGMSTGLHRERKPGDGRRGLCPK